MMHSTCQGRFGLIFFDWAKALSHSISLNKQFIYNNGKMEGRSPFQNPSPISHPSIKGK